MGGLMKWLKKDGSMRTRRRESAPLQFFKQKPTSEEKLRNSLIRFTQFREHQRIQRLSMGANDIDAYHTISGDAPNFSNGNTTPTDQNLVAYQSSTCPTKLHHNQTILDGRMEKQSPNGNRTKKISVQFHLGESTDESDLNFDQSKSRHSLPAIVTNAHVRGMRRHSQNYIDSTTTTTIQEEAIEEFEEANCMYNNSDSVNDDQSSCYRSPPMKFYKQNLNPYPIAYPNKNSETTSLSTLCSAFPIRENCPEKPKRLLINNKKSRKLLTEAHFTGAYRNFEINSPFYSDNSSIICSMEKQNVGSIDTESGLNGGSGGDCDNLSQLEHYQIIVNKHGDEVEYALPCVNLPECQRRQKLPDCLMTSDNSQLANEKFQEDPMECIRILNENFEMTSNTSISMHEQDDHRKSGKVMVTDLDKSIDSTHTIDDDDDELEIVSKTMALCNLDFNRLLSPRRDTNDETILRTSTLKKKKKISPAKTTGKRIESKRNRDLFGDDNNYKGECKSIANEIIEIRNKLLQRDDEIKKMADELNSKQAQLTKTRNQLNQIKTIAREYKLQFAELQQKYYAAFAEKSKKPADQLSKSNELLLTDRVKELNAAISEKQEQNDLLRSENEALAKQLNEFNNAILELAISKDLDFKKEEEESMKDNRPLNKKIEQPFGPKEILETKLSNTNNSYQFIIDDYELPHELIARNNKIRRCTWLSSDQVNNTQLQTKNDDALSTLNESNDSSKKMNVSIKIVHKQLTPTKNTTQNDSSLKSDCSTASLASSEDASFSVKSRIKFFRSLESQPVQRRTPNKNKSKMNISRRSEMSFNEAKKAIEKAQRHTYPSSNQPVQQNLNQQLIKEIGDITADIKKCLSKNKYLSEKRTDKSEINEQEIDNLLNADFSEADESVALLIDDLLNQNQKHILEDENAKNESHNEEKEAEKRNSVRETVQKFESSLRNEKNDNSFSFQKIENKLLNEKIFNTDLKSDINNKRDNKFRDEVTDEKVEEVFRFGSLSEAENEAGAQIQAIESQDMKPIAETDISHQSQTLIKRTFYQESIISGSNIEVPELKTLLANTPTVTSVTRKSSFTTRVTLNMRKSRRSSDIGLIAQNQQFNDLAGETEVRHSICGSPLPILGRNNSVDATASRKLDRLTGEKHNNQAAAGFILSNDQHQTSSVLTGIFNGKQIQSIEDLYIDDDYGGIGLAANMKLMTNSTDSLDNIDFDVIATHIFEQNSESMMSNNYTQLNTNLDAIEQGKNDDNDDEDDNVTAEQ